METDGVDLEEKEAAGGGERTTSPNSPCRLASRSAQAGTHAGGALMREAHMRVLMREGLEQNPAASARPRAQPRAHTPCGDNKGKGKSPQALQRKTSERPAR